MAEQNNQMGFLARARVAISNVIRPKGFMQGPFESTRQVVTRTRVDAPPPTDFKNELTEATRREMLRLSRWLSKNSGLYRQLTKDTSIYTVGDGIVMQANGGDFEWQSNVEAEWEHECESPEVTGRYSMLECQYIISELLDTDGEVFAIKVKRGGAPKFQLIEAHRVETPPSLFNDGMVNDGIRYDSVGRPLKYYVKQTDGTFSEIPAASMMHIYEATHPSAGRGFPPHQHAINNLRDEMDLLSMEKVAARDNSRISRILKTADPSPDMGDVGLGTPTNGGPTDIVNLNRVLGGVTAVLQPNESLVAHQSARPTTAFTGFIDHLRRDSVMGSVPYEFLVNPTQAGGPAARLVTAKAGRYFARRQNIIIKRFLDPYFKFWLGTKISKKEIPTAKNWWKVDWVVTKSVTLDAGRMGADERADIEMGRVPLEDDFASRGYQFEKTMRKRAKNFLFIKKLAEETGLTEDKLFKFAPQGGMPGAGGAPGMDPNSPTQMAVDPNDPMAQILAAVKGQSIPKANPNADPVADIEPELEAPDVPKPIPAVPQTEVSVDILPKQNQGLSQPVDQPLQRR